MRKFKCIKTFVIDENDDCSLDENEAFIVEEGSIWTQDTDAILEWVDKDGVKLYNDDDAQWLELCQEYLKEYFEPVKYKVWAFENKNDPGYYLADGIDCLWLEGSNKEGDAGRLENALLVIRTDLAEATKEDLESNIKMFRSLSYLDWEFVEQHYKPVLVEINEEQLEIVRDRNEW